MSERFDTGAILAQGRLPILDQDSAGSLAARSLSLGSQLLPSVLAALERGTTTEQPQDETQATYEGPLRLSGVDFGRPAEQVHAQIRSALPRPGATTALRGRTLRILGSALFPTQAQGAAGEILSVAGRTARVMAKPGTLLITVDEGSAPWLRPGAVLSAQS